MGPFIYRQEGILRGLNDARGRRSGIVLPAHLLSSRLWGTWNQFLWDLGILMIPKDRFSFDFDGLLASFQYLYGTGKEKMNSRLAISRRERLRYLPNKRVVHIYLHAYAPVYRYYVCTAAARDNSRYNPPWAYDRPNNSCPKITLLTTTQKSNTQHLRVLRSVRHVIGHSFTTALQGYQVFVGSLNSFWVEIINLGALQNWSNLDMSSSSVTLLQADGSFVHVRG
ncbi:hypothetical protein B0H66DRAFT_78093 [Apodospora peruviana]|uniref:Uncharacterized protein n=1 Tax=Apodospora peruviana TaxID=516989 RepID=A0AAE0ITH9_9PEZI|nr:hypothetical protein B0H66DRAFT_78093 [Apodospora peruviana]